jgi:SH3-like domain-containing protein
MTFNEQLRIQSTTADEQTVTLSLLTGDRIAVEVVDGDEDGTTIDLTLSLTEAETLMAKLATMVAQAKLAKMMKEAQ